jgi:hypothetical protein
MMASETILSVELLSVFVISFLALRAAFEGYTSLLAMASRIRPSALAILLAAGVWLSFSLVVVTPLFASLYFARHYLPNIGLATVLCLAYAACVTLRMTGPAVARRRGLRWQLEGKSAQSRIREAGPKGGPPPGL